MFRDWIAGRGHTHSLDPLRGLARDAIDNTVSSHESDTRRHHRIIENGYHGLDRDSLCASEQLHGISTSLSDDLVHSFDEPRLPQQIVNRLRILTEFPGDLRAWDAHRTQVSRERVPAPLALDLVDRSVRERKGPTTVEFRRGGQPPWLAPDLVSGTPRATSGMLRLGRLAIVPSGNSLTNLQIS